MCTIRRRQKTSHDLRLNPLPVAPTHFSWCLYLIQSTRSNSFFFPAKKKPTNKHHTIQHTTSIHAMFAAISERKAWSERWKAKAHSDERVSTKRRPSEILTFCIEKSLNVVSIQYKTSSFPPSCSPPSSLNTDSLLTCTCTLSQSMQMLIFYIYSFHFINITLLCCWMNLSTIQKAKHRNKKQQSKKEKKLLMLCFTRFLHFVFVMFYVDYFSSEMRKKIILL